jgi:hypothetical protein
MYARCRKAISTLCTDVSIADSRKVPFIVHTQRKDYRVRALNARRQSMHAHHQNELPTTKAVEAHTTAIMTREFSGALYKPIEQDSSPILSWPKDFAAASVSLVWRYRRTLNAQGTTHIVASTTFLLLLWCRTL